MKNDPLNILEFWKAVEQFTPPAIETKLAKAPLHVKSIQAEVLGDYDIPWRNREAFPHQQTLTHRWVYRVFLGAVNIHHICNEMIRRLGDNEENFNPEKIGGVSCLCSFEVDYHGQPLIDSLIVPDYFLGMGALAYRKADPQGWLTRRVEIEGKLHMAFRNFCDKFKQDPVASREGICHEDLQALISDYTYLATWEELLSNRLLISSAIIYARLIKIEPSREPAKGTNLEKNVLKEDEEIDMNSSLLNSFLAKDLQKVSTFLKKENKCPLGLKMYLKGKPLGPKIDLNKDREALKTYTSPSYMQPARWPLKGDYPLALAQQLAVNLACHEKEGLFSVNGPPGTGKSTLLRDVIANVAVNRAKVLANFTDPHEAYKESVSSKTSEGFTYKIWKLHADLYGHEIFVTSSNNGAVENISKQIPRFSEIDMKWDLDYFGAIASFVLEEKAWGLGAAPLGSKKNRASFFNKFWSAKPKEGASLHKKYGLEYLLKNPLQVPIESRPKHSCWKKAREAFLTTLQTYDKFHQSLEELQEALTFWDSIQKKEKKLKRTYKDKAFDYQKLQDHLKQTEQAILKVRNDIKTNQLVLENLKILKPNWWEVCLAFLTKRSDYPQWKQQLFAAINSTQTTQAALSQLSADKLVLLERQQNLENSLKKTEATLKTTQEKAENYKKVIDSYTESMGKCLPDKTFWSLPDEKLQLLLPWYCEQLHTLRGQLFIDAMNLHQAFILTTAEKLMNNLRAANQVIRGGSLWMDHERAEREHLIRTAWATFFMVVPVVSSTFASFAPLCGDLGCESIGWLLIDEAGQAVPQAAVGAIWRAKRSIIVGDPMQITPVVTIPFSMEKALRHYYNISDEWSTRQESVQTLSDRVNPYGATLTQEGVDTWVGCPLRVHRRCQDPMFSIANEIAYNNSMVQATPVLNSALEDTIKNAWIHVSKGRIHDNWLPDEGDVTLRLLEKLFSHYNKLPSLYIISPYNSVAFQMGKLLRASFIHRKSLRISDAEMEVWIKKSVGTIHTFQGKEADILVLLLGGNPSKIGSIQWAAAHPNMLNVALTRARKRLFVVGNHDIWSLQTYFQTLSHALPKISIDQVALPATSLQLKLA